MSNEIKEILEYYRKYMSIKDCIKLSKIEDHITNLQQKVEQYENPDDLTLFYMWLDEKAKDKMKHLQQENERLNQLIKSLRGNIKDITKTSSNRKKAILDLMKKIEKLKKEIEFLKTSPFLFLKIEDDDLVRSYAFMKKELKDYKSRTEKAVELLKQDKQSASFNSAEALVINTLQGGKNE